MPVTRPARILTDLLNSGYADLEHLASIAVDATAAGKLAADELVDVCAPFAAQYGLPAGDGHGLAQLLWRSYTGQELPAA